MNSSDPFEERLRQTPFRTAPSALRDKVLRGPGRIQRSEPSRPNPTSWLRWLREQVRPTPLAWGTLGLAWALVALVNISALELPENSPTHPAPRRISAAWMAAFHEQRAMLHSLLQDPPAPALAADPGPGAQLWRHRQAFELTLA